MSNWCRRCEWEGNNPEALYCRLCGSPLMQQTEKPCLKCGNSYVTPSNTSYCDSCGTKLVEDE